MPVTKRFTAEGGVKTRPLSLASALRDYTPRRPRRWRVVLWVALAAWLAWFSLGGGW